MDNDTLKALVIKYKESGMTYQEIADKLASDYKVERTRQALQGMYTRAVRKVNTEDEKARMAEMADIINIFCLGYNRKETTEIVSGLGHDVNYNKVVNTIRENEDYVKSVEDAISERLSTMVQGALSIDELRDVIIYKGILPKKKKLDEYIAEAYKIIIRQDINKRLARIYQFTEDTTIAREVADEFNVKFSLTDIKDEL